MVGIDYESDEVQVPMENVAQLDTLKTRSKLYKYSMRVFLTLALADLPIVILAAAARSEYDVYTIWGLILAGGGAMASADFLTKIDNQIQAIEEMLRQTLPIDESSEVIKA